MFCKHCGKQIEDDVRFCKYCGGDQEGHSSYDSTQAFMPARSSPPERRRKGSPKSRLIAALLAFFLGWCGAHRYYVGKIGTGVLQLLLCWCLIGEIWALVDFIFILCGNFEDSNGMPLLEWDATI